MPKKVFDHCDTRRCPVLLQSFKKIRGGKFCRVLIIPNLNVLNINLVMHTVKTRV